MSVFDLDKWQEIFSTLRRNKLRTVMTAIGVFWGIFMLVLMLGFGNGLKFGVQKNMLGFAANSVYVWGQRTSKPHHGLPPGRRVRFRTQDIEALERDVAGIELLAPRIQLGGWRDGNNVTRGERTGNFGVMGDYPAFAGIEGIFPDRGRFINPLDLERRRKVVVIGDQVKRLLFSDHENPIGQYVRIRGVYFQVVGTFRSDRPGDQGDRANQTLHVPFSTFQMAFNAHHDVGWFAITGKPDVDAEELEQRVRKALLERHGVAPDDPQALGSFNAAERFGQVRSLFGGIEFFIWFVGVATMLAGVLGVSNIMLISVKERTKEIGVRKALGATPASIVALIVQEALALTTLAGYLGLVAGVLALEGFSRFVGTDASGPLGSPAIHLGTALAATGVLVVAGLISGIAPARHAAKIQPVEALRAE
ncbi:MAG TPA: ABC transporter permease [Polyangiaceae bacterium]